MSKKRYRQRDEHLFPLTEGEKADLGWDPGQLVFSSRAPDGMRIIPTREILEPGIEFYGYISTMEPPPGVSDEDWALAFGTGRDPRPSLPS